MVPLESLLVHAEKLQITSCHHHYIALSCIDAEDEEFVPVPRQLDLYFEYRSTSTDTWGRIHFRSLETLQPQGPFIHQAEVPADIAARELHLTMSDWPQYYTLHLKTIIDTDANVNSQIHTESYKSAVVISDVHSVNATVAARLLATHMAHHMAIGFDVYLLYTRGAELSQALHQNSVTARYLQQGQLSLVSIDSLQIPQYGLEGWAEWAAYDPTKLISYNHAALLLWGKKFRLAVLDIDELLSTNTPGSTVSSWFDRCYPNADIISASRVEVVCSACQAQGLSELGFFEQAWDPYNPTDILRNFSTITSFNLDPKSVFDSNKVAQVWLHRPATLPGSTAIDVVSRSESDLAENCVCVVHLLNLFKDRIHNTSDQAAASRFQWQVQRHRSPAHGIEHI